MGKVKLNQANKISEGILGSDDYTPVLLDRGFADRSIGDEFFRTGRNSGSDVIENPDMDDSSNDPDLSDDELEDMGYDYDGGGEQGDDESYPMHALVRDHLFKLDQRLTDMETVLSQLFGSQGTVYNPIATEQEDANGYGSDQEDEDNY